MTCSYYLFNIWSMPKTVKIYNERKIRFWPVLNHFIVLHRLLLYYGLPGFKICLYVVALHKQRQKDISSKIVSSLCATCLIRIWILQSQINADLNRKHWLVQCNRYLHLTKTSRLAIGAVDFTYLPKVCWRAGMDSPKGVLQIRIRQDSKLFGLKDPDPKDCSKGWGYSCFTWQSSPRGGRIWKASAQTWAGPVGSASFSASPDNHTQCNHYQVCGSRSSFIELLDPDRYSNCGCAKFSRHFEKTIKNLSQFYFSYFVMGRALIWSKIIVSLASKNVLLQKFNKVPVRKNKPLNPDLHSFKILDPELHSIKKIDQDKEIKKNECKSTTLNVPRNNIEISKNFIVTCSVSDPDPHGSPLQLTAWIRIRIRIRDADSGSGSRSY